MKKKFLNILVSDDEWSCVVHVDLGKVPQFSNIAEISIEGIVGKVPFESQKVFKVFNFFIPGHSICVFIKGFLSKFGEFLFHDSEETRPRHYLNNHPCKLFFLSPPVQPVYCILYMAIKLDRVWHLLPTG